MELKYCVRNKVCQKWAHCFNSAPYKRCVEGPLSPDLPAGYEHRIHSNYHFIDAHDDVRHRHTNHSNTLSTQRTQAPFHRTLQGTKIRSRKECLRL